VQEPVPTVARVGRDIEQVQVTVNNDIDSVHTSVVENKNDKIQKTPELNSQNYNDNDLSVELPFPIDMDIDIEGEWISRRQFSKHDGFYVEGNVNNFDVIFCLDTGCSRSLLSVKAFNRLEEKPVLRPRLPHQRIISADGAEIASPGFAMLNVTLGKFRFKHLFCIAEVEDEALLGSDILLNGELGPVDILLSQKQLAIDGCRIPILVQDNATKQSMSTRKVTLFEDKELMPNSYSVVTVCVERGPGFEDTVCLLEPAQQFEDKYQLIMPCGIIDLQRNQLCSVIMCNPKNEPVKLYANTVVGFIEDEIDMSFEQTEQGEEEETSEYGIRAVHGFSDYSDPCTLIPEINISLPNHLVDLYERSKVNLNLEERTSLANLLAANSHVFSRNDKDIGYCDKVKLTIPTGDSRPVRQRPHKVPLAFAADEERLLSDLQDQGVIRPSSSPWASPIHLVRKKNGDSRLTCDYRALNKLIANNLDSYPLPLISDCQNALSGNKYFCVSDIQSAYFNIPVDEKDIPKTAIISKYGLYEFLRCPQGLSASPSCFQRCIELVLRGLQYNSLVIYLDDLLVYGKSYTETIDRLDTVFQRLSEAGMKLAPDKTSLFQHSVTFLGSVMSQDGIQPDPAKLAKISNWPTPTSKRDIRSFLGLCAYYKRFIKSYASRAKPLTTLTEKDRRFSWSPEAEEAFNDLKSALVSSDIMAYPMDNCMYILDCDASDLAAGAVLSQVQHGVEKVIAYGSKGFTSTQQRYCCTHRELMAIRIFIEYWSQYLKGNHFLVRSDHASLKYLFSIKHPKSRVARWLDFFSGYNFEIQHRSGVKSGNCDALSRCPNIVSCKCQVGPLPCGPCPTCEQDMYRIHRRLEDEDENDSDAVRITRDSLRSHKQTVTNDTMLQEFAYTPEELRARQLADPDIGAVLRQVEGGEGRPRTVSHLSPATRHYFLLWNTLIICNGVLYRTVTINGKLTHQIILTPDLRKVAFDLCHTSLLGGHFAKKKSKQKLLAYFYWYKIEEDVKLMVLACDKCESQRKPRKFPKAPLKSFPSGHRGDTISIDFLGNLPMTKNGNVAIMVVNDHFTKWVEVYATPNQTAETTARYLLNNWISTHGMPLTILSDQGRNFVSSVFMELCKFLGIDKRRTSPGHPQCNGVTERFNQVVMHTIKCFIDGQQDTWDEWLGCLTSAFRSAVHSTTQMSPNLMTFGEELRTPCDYVFRNAELENPELDRRRPQFVLDLKARLVMIHKIVRENIQTAISRQKVSYDKRQVLNKYEIGSYCWYLSHKNQLHLAPKLRVHYEGPFVIVGKASELNYYVAFNDKKDAQIIHHNRLKPYEGRKVLPWAEKAVCKFSETQN